MAEDDKIRIYHLADTHLGYSAYRKVDSDGVNQREKDIYNAFVRAIDHIVETKPDLVLHAGDLFDTVRPTNRAISVAMEQLIRLSKEKIPTVIVAGNHETPKLRETGHVFKLFDHLDYIYPVYNDKKETFQFNIEGKKVSVHAVPHCRDKEEFTKALKDAMPDASSDYNILVTHGAVQAIQIFKMNEFNEYIIPFSMISKGFDYVALGHYHKHVKIRENVVYSGSTERLSFTEAGDEKGLVEIELGSFIFQRFHSIPTRRMIDLEPIDCKGLTNREIVEEIKNAVKNRDIKDAIVRLSLINIDSSTYRSLDAKSIKSVFSDALHFEIKHSIGRDIEQLEIPGTPIGDLLTEFERFMEKASCRNKSTILELGKKYIQRAQAEREEK